MCRTWNHDRRFLRVGPIVRRNVLHVIDGKILRCGAASWCGYRNKDLGRVEAFFEVRFERKVVGRSGSGAAPPPRTAKVEFVSIVWTETTATSACAGEVQATRLFVRRHTVV